MADRRRVDTLVAGGVAGLAAAVLEDVRVGEERDRRARRAGRQSALGPVAVDERLRAVGIRRRAHQQRRLRLVERHAGRGDRELVPGGADVRDRALVEQVRRGHRVRDIQVPTAVDVADRDRAAVARADEARRRIRQRGLGDLERDLVALRVPEAHLQLAVERVDARVIRDVREEEHGRGALRDLREIGVELAADTEQTVREVQLADGEELPVA